MFGLSYFGPTIPTYLFVFEKNRGTKAEKIGTVSSSDEWPNKLTNDFSLCGRTSVGSRMGVRNRAAGVGEEVVARAERIVIAASSSLP